MTWRNLNRILIHTLFTWVLLSFPQQSLANPPTLKNQSPASFGWQGGFFNDGVDGYVSAIAIDGSKVFVGGSFYTAGNAVAKYVTMWDGTQWNPLGSGVNADVFALALDGRGGLFVGGWFTQAGEKPANHVARWNGQDWEELGSGVNGVVKAIAVSPSGEVYVGGFFNNAGGVPANNIAKWNGSSWSALKNGVGNIFLKNVVYTITIDRYGYLYAGGSFTNADEISVNNIARWDGENWEALEGGVLGDPSYLTTIYSLATDGRGNLYAGGRFTSAGGKTVSNLARWDGEDWWNVGGGVQGKDMYNTNITSILVDGSVIYVGGDFFSAGGESASNIAKWNGAEFENMAGGMQGNFPNSASVDALAIDRDGRIYAGGFYHIAGGQCASNIAMWDGSDWQSLGSAHSLDGRVTTMVSDRKGGFYVGGEFVCASGQIVNHIAHWDGATWTGLGKGLAGGVYLAYPMSLVLDQNEQLYVAGAIEKAGDIPVKNIAKWTGTEWQALGEGVASVVRTLAVDSHNRVYAGGYFEIDGDNPLQNNTVLRWDGSQWEAIGTGFDRAVITLAIDIQDRLIAAGFFHNAGGKPALGLARWDGSEWESIVDEGVEPSRVLLINRDTIYGAGKTVWKIRNGMFEYIDRGFGNVDDDPWVRALALDQQGRLVVGGQFSTLGGVDTPNIARWNGTNWESLGSEGVNGAVVSILVDDGGKLIVGGEFDQVGGKVSNNLAIWKEPNYAWLPLVRHGSNIGLEPHAK